MGIEIYAIEDGCCLGQRDLLGRLIWGFRYDAGDAFGAYLFERRNASDTGLEVLRFSDPVQGFAWAFHEPRAEIPAPVLRWEELSEDGQGVIIDRVAVEGRRRGLFNAIEVA